MATAETIRVLVVEDNATDAKLMLRELTRAGFDPDWTRVETESEYLAQLDRHPDIILSDSNLPEFDGFEALDLLTKRGLDIPFILVSGRVGEDLAVDAMKRGACDYLLKDRLARLGEAVRRAIDQRRVRSEKERAVEALRQSEERYRLVSEITSDYAYSLAFGPDGKITCEWITEAFTRITGFTADDLNHAGWGTLSHPEDRPIASRHVAALREGRADTVEMRIVDRSGNAHWVRVFGRPVRGEDRGAIFRILGAAQDITEQKLLEQKLRQAQKMESIGRLAGGVAHDFNNLLTVISGYGQLLRGELPQQSAESGHLDEMLHAARRAAQLTSQLLAFSRRQVLQPRIINLNRTMADMEKLLRRLIGDDLELVTHPAPGLGMVRADPGQIEQVVMNLALNARDAMPDGGRLSFETANVDLPAGAGEGQLSGREGPHVLLSVTDSGVGMDPETLSHIFEPFFTTKSAGKGTGLGLATVYGIVEQSGGSIVVNSEPGRGTTFRIYFPRAEKPEETVTAAAPRLPSPGGSETIILVEDNKSVRGLIRQVLTRQGYRILETENVDQALERCREHEGSIELLITDVIMPKLNGPQLAAAALRLRPDMRVLYISGYTGSAVLEREGADARLAFFEKPFTPDALARKVREVLDAPASTPEA